MSNVMSVKLAQQMNNDLIAACRSRLPQEACGVIYGKKSESGETLIPDGFSLVRNVSSSANDSFAFDRNDWIAACYEAQKNQRHIVGVFHSHPAGTCAPSVRDEQALVPWESYWIVGFAGPHPNTAVFKHTGDEWIPLPLTCVP
ncbi:M67 family metallopeptidase [Cohnella yongneupensis]|uniref:M67 family metallopeptidase n=1 Tax=Cohnella yongneupensis TaxID=425006 RepID=A0ABW0QWP4_9BACL